MLDGLNEEDSTASSLDSVDYFDNITQSAGAARLLIEKAHEHGSLIEGLCLYVSIIDVFLRLAIIYTRTQKAEDLTYDVSKKMIYQDDDEWTYSEKQIYNLAYEEAILSVPLYEKLLEMYAFRNKVVHRFALCKITYDQIAEACIEFEKIYQEIFDILVILEHGPNGIQNPDLEERLKIELALTRKLGLKNDSGISSRFQSPEPPCVILIFNSKHPINSHFS